MKSLAVLPWRSGSFSARKTKQIWLFQTFPSKNVEKTMKNQPKLGKESVILQQFTAHNLIRS